MFIVTAVLSGLLAAAMAQSAVKKINPDKDSLVLRDRLGVPPRVWTAVGVPEALAAVGLVAGLWWAPLGVAAAVGVALVMAGAVAFHLRARLFGAALAPPIGIGAVAIAAAILRALTA
ncbi:DoxX family protein [Frankia sp. CNm7]|uniref:DoxX family protein n=1 Tax=Frankia nepalensis TaxID=1836974 RepID=A0A937RE75_9ACTN|nr:DoxX family protein [Frankia nepalensis]MBL7501915.1 DoxX family protein [Frankia nepalensis]MBL7516469.1 DoxX family protein [Frankia nepalensis]MBL7518074.1 DoxX family protein [Frankia nepalensis]MBL7628790.1 DoxX family protein [Frankia nepalensis]